MCKITVAIFSIKHLFVIFQWDEGSQRFGFSPFFKDRRARRSGVRHHLHGTGSTLLPLARQANNIQMLHASTAQSSLETRSCRRIRSPTPPSAPRRLISLSRALPPHRRSSASDPSASSKTPPRRTALPLQRKLQLKSANRTT